MAYRYGHSWSTFLHTNVPPLEKKSCMKPWLLNVNEVTMVVEVRNEFVVVLYIQGWLQSS